ncbi:MAG: nucleoside-diphosphate sugar epimerase/dehydratase [Clostridia bacterium]
MEEKKKKASIRYSSLLTLAKDILVYAVAYVLAYVLGRNGAKFEWKSQYIEGIIAVSVTIVWLTVFRSYRVVWRYAGISEMLNVIGAFCATFVTLIIIDTSMSEGLPMSITIMILYIYFSLSASMLLRFYKPLTAALVRTFGNKKIVPPENIIVYGAGYTGAALIKRFIGNPDEGYNPVAILDDDASKRGSVVSGIRVVGGRDNIRETMNKYKATTIAIAITKINREEMRKIYEECRRHNATVKAVAGITGAEDALSSEAVSLKNVNIEDLLRRREHKIDRALLDNFIKDKIVMVTGGAGSIGSELCRQALQYGAKKLIIFDHHENGMFEINEEFKKSYSGDKYSLIVGTVKDREKLRSVMDEVKPQIVFHAAAYKHVPMMEINGDEAVKNNIFGTQNVIDQCAESGVEKFILISTDKAVNPANIMGASKRMAELLVENKASVSNGTVYAAVRFGNVLGSSGSVIPTFIKQINSGGPVTVTHREMKRYFMTIPEAVRLVMQAGALAKGGEVFVLDMGEPVYIYDLASDLIKLSGLEPNRDIKIEITGLRSGEKLFEELRFSDEDVDVTTHEGIFVCRLEPVNKQKLRNTLTKLKQAADDGNKLKAEKVIFEMVPDIYRNL